MEIKFTGVVGAPCNKDFASITKIPIDVATSKIRDQLSMLSRFAGSPFVVKVTLSDETLFGKKEKAFDAQISSLTVGAGTSFALSIQTTVFLSNLKEMISKSDEMIDVLVTISLDDMLIGRLKEDDAFGNDPDENPPTEIPVSEEETSGTTGEKKRGRGRPRKS